jgi:exosortase A
LVEPQADASAAASDRVAERSRDAPWRLALAALAVAFVGLCIVFRGTVAQMVETWYVSATFNHGFLIAPISLWLVWERREALEQYMPKPDFRGLIPLALCAVGWLVANAAGVNSGREFAFVGMLQFTVLTILGWRLFRALLFPLAFLLFAVPFGDFLIPSLQDLTALMVVEGLGWVGIPVFLDGVFLSIPSGNFEVAEACSGVRFLIATIALGALFANMSFRSLSRRAIIVALSIAVPIVANGIRAFGIVWLAHISDHKIAVGVDHLIYGWIFFAIVTVLLLAIGMTFRETDGDNEIYMPAPADRVPSRLTGATGLFAAAAAAVAVSVFAPAYSGAMLGRGIAPLAQPVPAPEIGGGWARAAAVGTTWRPRFAGADSEQMTAYAKDGRPVYFYLAYYTHQRQGAELINSANSFVDGKAWSRASSGFADVRYGDREITVKATRLIGRTGTGRLVWEWYRVGDRYTSDRYTAKLYEAASKLFGTTQAAAAIIVAADYHDSPAEAVRTLQDFLGNLGGLDKVLGGAAAG